MPPFSACTQEPLTIDGKSCIAPGVSMIDTCWPLALATCTDQAPKQHHSSCIQTHRESVCGNVTWLSRDLMAMCYAVTEMLLAPNALVHGCSSCMTDLASHPWWHKAAVEWPQHQQAALLVTETNPAEQAAQLQLWQSAATSMCATICSTALPRVCCVKQNANGNNATASQGLVKKSAALPVVSTTASDEHNCFAYTHCLWPLLQTRTRRRSSKASQC